MSIRFQKLVNRIHDLIRNSDDPHKGEELQVAHRFIEYYNQNYGTDYILSKTQPRVDDPIDVLVHSKSNPKRVLKIQVKTFDAEVRKCLDDEKKGKFLRIINSGEEHPLINKLKEDVKRWNLDINVKKELILLLDGFWSVSNTLSDEMIGKLSRLFNVVGFQGVWIVYSEKRCIKL